MKPVLLTLFLIISQLSFSQKNGLRRHVVTLEYQQAASIGISSFESAAFFEEGILELEKYLNESMTYPQKFNLAGTSASIYALLKIDLQGNVVPNESKIVRGISPTKINDNILQLLLKSKPWIPAKSNEVNQDSYLLIKILINSYE